MKLRLISVVAAAGFLSGCGGLAFMNLAMIPAVGTPTVSAAAGATNLTGYGLPIVGNYETYNELFTGRTVRDLSDDSEMVAVQLINSGVTCDGRLHPPDDGWPTEWPIGTRNCLNRLVRGTLSCTDGRELVLDWRATQCRTAYGQGFDRDGGTIQFAVLESADAAAAKAEILTAQLTSYPPLPLAR